MKKAKRGRPKTVYYSRRTLIQVNDDTMNEIKRFIKTDMSISEFFRRSAEIVLDNPHLIKR